MGEDTPIRYPLEEAKCAKRRVGVLRSVSLPGLLLVFIISIGLIPVVGVLLYVYIYIFIIVIH